MVINKELLQLRKKIADKRPDFVRQEAGGIKNLQLIGENQKEKTIK